MRNHSIMAVAVGALAFAGCSSDKATDLQVSDTKGAAKFSVAIPETDDAINGATLTLTCPGFTQSHDLDLSERLITASFGGVAPGTCTATLAGTTEAGNPCAGEGTVQIVVNQITEQTLTLTCSATGGQATQGGGAVLGVDLQVDVTDCPDKVKKVYAIPGALPVTASTSAQLELLDGQTIEGASLTAAASSVGGVTISELTDCAAGASNCWTVTCSAAGTVDLDVTTQDGECTDTERLVVVCEEGTGGGPVCGNGALEAGEECDDGNTADGDGCSSTCAIEQTGPVCGDGNVEAGEECDDGNIVDGDGCSSTCTIEQAGPVCGNGALEAGEECDDGNTADGDGCSSTCVIETPVSDNACLDCMSNPDGVFYSVLGSALDTCLGDADCSTMLTCFTESKCANGVGSVAECVCGLNADIDACNQGTAAATGVCVDELRAIVGDVSNADLLLAVTSQQNASGRAYALYNPAATNAQAQCNASNQCGGDPVSE